MFKCDICIMEKCRDVKSSRPVWPRGQILCLIGFGLGLVKHWPRSHVSWPRGLNIFYVIHEMKNKHVNGPKNYCQLNQFSSYQRILLTEMSCYVNSVLLMSILWFMIWNMKVICIYMLHDSLDTWPRPRPNMFWPDLTENFWPRPHTFWPRPWPHPSLASLTSLMYSNLLHCGTRLWFCCRCVTTSASHRSVYFPIWAHAYIMLISYKISKKWI